MKKIQLILILLILFTLNFGKYTSANLILEKTVKIHSNDTIENLTLEILIPTNSPNQRVNLVYFSDNFTIVDNRAIFNFDKIREKVINLKFEVIVNYIKRNEEKKNENLNKYTKESKYVIFNEEIYNLSKNFSKEGYQYIIEALDWMQKNIEYSYPYSDINYNEVYENSISSDNVIKMKKGVCDEFSNLFLAILRISGIPSRIVVGEVLINDKWVPHAWIEFYDSKYGWIEVDPTFGEFLNLDPFRIRYAYGVDTSEIYEKVRGISKNNITVKSETKIDVINYSTDSNIDLQVRFLENKEENAQTALVFLRNNEDYPIYTNVRLITPKEIECECNNRVFLEENSQASLNFKLNLPKMEKNVRYTFPIIVQTDFRTINSSFSRLDVEVLENNEMEVIINERMKFFIGIFLIVMLAIIVIAIIKGW